jgi:hypothetical protein
MKKKIQNFFKKKENSIDKFYDTNYVITMDNDSLEINGKNAQIFLIIKKETFTNEHYKLLKNSFTSDLRICGLYSKKDENKPRSPKKYTRKMLCYGLYLLLQHHKISLTDIISLEADPSPNDTLVKKVYIPMGFELVASTSQDITGGIMKATVKTILSWCDTTTF